MDFAQTVDHGQQDALQLPLRERAVPLEQTVERLAVLVVHDDVGGAVGLEVVAHPDHVAVLEARQRPSLVEEAREAPLEVGAIDARLRVHRGAVPDGELVRQVLLDRHPVAERVVLGQVRDPKAADTQHVQDAVAVDQVPGRQRLLVLSVDRQAPPRSGMFEEIGLMA